MKMSNDLCYLHRPFDKILMLLRDNLLVGGQCMYAEWLVGINFILNLVLLRFVQAVTYVKIKRWRLYFGAFISAWITVIFYGSWWGVLLSFIALIGLAFSFRLSSFMQQGGWLIVATLFAGGLLLVVQSYFYSSSFFIYIGLALCIVCSSLFLLKRGWLTRMQKNVQQHYLISCQLQLASEELHVSAYIDTANECIEPLSQAPVHFISFKAVQAQLSPQFRQSLLQWSESEPLVLSMFSRTVQKTIRLVPITTVRGTTSFVPAFRTNVELQDHTFCDHYVVFTKNDAHFPQQAQMIAHVIVLIKS
jgi:stage II sporulation protein GA (sporulation sigma-E factor processing peptidase)